MGQGERTSVVRTALRWLAPLLSLSVLALLVARASSCSEPDGPAAVVPDPDTKAAPVQQAPVEGPAPAAIAPPDAGRRDASPTLDALPRPEQREFLGGSKSGSLLPRPRSREFLGGSKSSAIELPAGNDETGP